MARYRVIVVEDNGVELGFQTELDLDANNTDFDPTGTGFSATTVQSAIVESKDLAIELPRFPLSAIHNGTLSDGQLVGVNNLVNNPLVIPVKSQVAEITYYQNGGSSRDGQLRFYRNSETAPNLFFTWTFNNTETAVAESTNAGGSDFTSPTFNQGDELLIYFDDNGSNPVDVSILVYMQAVQ